ncbi:MAG TPA: TOBE domain-containing protein [Jiangellaceae bacterium]
MPQARNQAAAAVGPARFRISEAARFLGVSDDSVRRWAEAGRLELSTDAAGRFVVEGAELARLVKEIVPADPSLPLPAESARNHFPGLVTEVRKDGVMAQVEIQAGPHRVVSLMSREAADELGLEPGVAAVASVKATNVVVDLPAGGPAIRGKSDSRSTTDTQ